MTNAKKALRENYLRMRKALSREGVEMRSFRIMRNLEDFIFGDEQVYLFYVPINREADLLPLARDLFLKGKTVLFPKLINLDFIEPYIIHDFYFDFKLGAYNIPEPDTEPYFGKIDVAFVPGVVFGKDGYRIGYGKGYYDRYLSKASIQKTVGISYDFQILPEVPHTVNDFQLDFIASESELIKIRK
jgi:5-formyltetrahydrofolate cyclo-ligase